MNPSDPSTETGMAAPDQCTGSLPGSEAVDAVDAEAEAGAGELGELHLSCKAFRGGSEGKGTLRSKWSPFFPGQEPLQLEKWLQQVQSCMFEFWIGHVKGTEVEDIIPDGLNS